MKTTRLVSQIMLISLALTLFTGCKGNNSSAYGTNAISMVLGVRSNFPEITITQGISDLIYNTCYSYGNISVTIVDGEPFTCANYDIKEVDKAIDDAKRKQIANENTSKISDDLKQYGAKTEEADTLKAITCAADNLKTRSEQNKELIVIDSGLSTYGCLDFTKNNLIENDADYIVSWLSDHDSLPDLSGITVKWFGCGQTAGNQKSLSTRASNKLTAIWRAILEAAGASKVDFDPTRFSSAYDDTHPYVSPVEIFEEQIEGKEICVKFDGESPVSFKENVAEYIDQSAADAALSKVYDKISNRNQKLVLVGSTATSGDFESCKVLSLQRAEAVKNTLVNLGMNGDLIECIGIGREECKELRVNDTDVNGKLIESQACKNRAVFIFSDDSDILSRVIG